MASGYLVSAPSRAPLRGLERYNAVGGKYDLLETFVDDLPNVGNGIGCHDSARH
jgi:hypothetical protein